MQQFMDHLVRMKILWVAAIPILILGACLKSKFNPNNINGATPEAGVLFIHAAAGLPAVDIYGANSLLNPSPIPYNSATNGYIGLTPDYYTFKWDSAGSSNTIASVFQSIPLNDLFTQLLYDSTDGAHRIVTIPDIVAGTSLLQANIRFINLCPDVSRMDVYLGGTKVYTDRSFLDCIENFTLDTFMQVNGGTNFPLTIRYTYNSDSMSTSSTVFLNQGDIYTLFASGFAGSVTATKLTVGIVQNY
jgi:hypothetical protein